LWVLVPCLVALAISLPLNHASPAGNEIWQEKAYLPGMAGISTGVLAALVAARCPSPRRSFSVALGGAGATGLIAVLTMGWILWTTLYDSYLLLLTFSVACLLVSLRWDGWRWPLPGLGWLRAKGRLSYEIYLTHMFVVYGAVRLYKAWGADAALGYLWYPPIVAVCWFLGWVVARYISAPADQILRGLFLRDREAEPREPRTDTV
jgi:peptidoglycan/LPS O-acetylase OafA/YrhL